MYVLTLNKIQLNTCITATLLKFIDTRSNSSNIKCFQFIYDTRTLSSHVILFDPRYQHTSHNINTMKSTLI